jgi:hypothetical protein
MRRILMPANDGATINRKDLDMKRTIILGIFILLAALLTGTTAFAISPAVKSSQDFIFTLDTLRSVRIMIENFGDDELKKKYSDITALFQEAGENYYGQNFTDSTLKFGKVKMDLILLLESIGNMYLKRTKEILDSTSKDSFNILIEYSKRSGLGEYFRKPYDPLRDIKPYDPEKYHLFHDRQRIEAYLRQGYKKYHQAKKVMEDPEIAMLRKRKNLTPNNINFIISRFSSVVMLCREAKQNGIEIHRTKNINELGKSLVKYNIHHGSIIPVYDDRIPEEYKVDANDNLGLIHSVELKKLGKVPGGTVGG